MDQNNNQPPQYNSNLQNPILSPTHFDNQPKPGATPQPQQPKPADATKGLSIFAVVLGIVAVIGIALGIWGLVDSIGTHDKLNQATEQLNAAKEIIGKIESDTGTKISSVDDVPTYSASTGYIYIDEWGVKIKVPKDIHKLSYTLDEKYRPQICFNGLEVSVTNIFPDFADIDRNPGGMGCLTRVASSEGGSDDSGRSFGEQVFSADGYNYFYEAPSKTFASSPSEQGLEKTAVQIIKNMLTTGVSSYK